MPADSVIDSVCLKVSLSDPGKVPLAMDNWGYFDGSLLAIGFMEDDSILHVEGTAVMVAPGLAISAKHVFTDRLANVLAGEQGICGLGLKRDGQAVMWVVQTVICLDDGGDLVMLSLRLASDLPAGGRFSSLPLTARTPVVGESLTIVGFRFDPYDRGSDAPTDQDIALAGDMYVANGEVTQVYWPIRDRILAPYPAIDVACGSLGGMSGGAVIDREGAIIGVVSRGFDAIDGEGPTLVAWIVDLFRWVITPKWPPGAYPRETQVARLPYVHYLGQEFVHIEGESVELDLYPNQ